MTSLLLSNRWRKPVASSASDFEPEVARADQAATSALRLITMRLSASMARKFLARSVRMQAGTLLILSGLAACAATPTGPTPEMTRAEGAIEQAQRAGAAEFASEPLASAQRHLADAKAAVGSHDNVRATRLVEEAFADARLADFTAQSVKSGKAADEVDTSIRTLETETNRPRSP